MIENYELSSLTCCGLESYVQSMNAEDWEELGREVADNTHLEGFIVQKGALNSEKMTSLFRGLTGSSSIYYIDLNGVVPNEPGIYDVSSMVPFVQNARCLRHITIHRHNMTPDGFAALFRALSNIAVEDLELCDCGLSTLDIDSNHLPAQLLN